MIFSNVIVTHNGRYYRFKRKTSNELECQVCYWRGQVIPPNDDTLDQYQAYVEQKYAPYQKKWSESTFKSESEALRWVAAHLSKDELIDSESEGDGNNG